MKKKELDIFDILEPATITVRSYQESTIPFEDEQWFDSGDITIREIAKLLPFQLPFIYCLLNEHPNLLPLERITPGRIEELILLDIMENLKCRSQRDYELESKILQLWKSCGGYINSQLRKCVNYGRSE